MGRHRGRGTPLTPLYAKEVSIIEANCRTGWRQCQCPPWPRDPLLSFLKAVSVTRSDDAVSTPPPCSHSPTCRPCKRRQFARDRSRGIGLISPLGPGPPPSSHPFNCSKLPQHPHNHPSGRPAFYCGGGHTVSIRGIFLGEPAAAVGMVILGCSGQERTHRGRCVLTGCAPAPPTITLRCTEQCSPDRVITSGEGTASVDIPERRCH